MGWSFLAIAFGVGLASSLTDASAETNPGVCTPSVRTGCPSVRRITPVPPTITSATFNPAFSPRPKGATAVIDWRVGALPAGCGAETMTVVGKTASGVQTASWTSAPFKPGTGPTYYGTTGGAVASGLVSVTATDAWGTFYHQFPTEFTNYYLTLTCTDSHLSAATSMGFSVVDTPPSISIVLSPAHTPSPPAAYIAVGGQVTVDWYGEFYNGCTGPAQVVLDGTPPAGQSRFHSVTKYAIDPKMGALVVHGRQTFTVSMDTFTDFKATASCANGWSTTTAPARVQLYQGGTPSASCNLQCFKVASPASGTCSLLQWCVPSNTQDPVATVQQQNPSATVTKVSDCYDYSICN